VFTYSARYAPLCVLKKPSGPTVSSSFVAIFRFLSRSVSLIRSLRITEHERGAA
jgi:hypothetical protein